ncbi:MAG: hypothetical protein LBC50_01380 [Candidatus Ancillula sp.]|jgi:hypothetical protein|nr:hypothetical protein [Candidatus Ancillula sp.]
MEGYNTVPRVSILGIIFFAPIIAQTHSINRRTASGQIITGGQYWLWQLGWSLVGCIPFALWIYCAAMYNDMNAVRQAASERLTTS